MAKVGIRRLWDESKGLAYGANWFSITHSFAQYVLEQKPWIRQYFRYSCCADELFLQTILENTSFAQDKYRPKDGVYANMHMVDWVRTNGKNPWTFRMEDYEAIIHSPYLFARKFSTAVDGQVVERIYTYVKDKNEKQKRSPVETEKSTGE